MNMEKVDDNELSRAISNSKPVPSIDKKLEEDIIKKTLDTLQSQTMGRAIDNNPSLMPEPGSNYWLIDGLPSRYKLYPEGTNIYGRPLKVLEIKKISSINDVNADYVINELLRKTVKGINTDDLYIADKLYIVFWLRANTYRDSGYVVNFDCTKCNAASEYHFEINNLEIQYLSDNYDPNMLLKLRSGDTIKMNFLTIADSLNIERFKELNTKVVGEIDSELINIAEMMKEINGKKLSLLEKYRFICDIDPGDFSHISQYIEENGMGIKPYMTVKCNKCGGTGPVGITFHASFLFPKYKS
jgi:hypothetical protein